MRRQYVLQTYVLPLICTLLALAAPARAAEELEINAKFGTLDFAIGNSKLFRTVGWFDGWKGNVSFDDANLQNSRIELVASTGSVRMFDSQQTARLKDADFFDVGRFPELVFRSTRIERARGDLLKVDGDITMRGVTRPMVLTVGISNREAQSSLDPRYGKFRGVGAIRRSEFGMTKHLATIGDLVEFSISGEARRRPRQAINGVSRFAASTDPLSKLAEAPRAAPARSAER